MPPPADETNGTPAATAADVMIRAPKTLGPDATVGQARAVLADGHVHMLLVVDGPTLRGTVLRDDLPPPDGDPRLDADAVVRIARLEGRTVAPDVDADAVRRALVAAGRRRLAVVNGDGALLGLVCLKRDRSGFCTDEGVARRAAGWGDPC